MHHLPLGRQVRSTDPKPSLSSVKSKSSDSSDNQHEAKPETSITSSRSSGALASDEIPADPVTDQDQDLEAGENQFSRSSSHEKTSKRGLCSGRAPLSEPQIRLLVGLYYLPHEHGPPAQSLLQDLTWLKANCHYVSVNGKKTPQQKVINAVNQHLNTFCQLRNHVSFSMKWKLLNSVLNSLLFNKVLNSVANITLSFRQRNGEAVRAVSWLRVMMWHHYTVLW